MMSDYERVERILRFLDEQYLDRPDLTSLSRRAGLSEYHFQRLFTRWAGVSPKRFLQFLTKEHARMLLDQSKDLLSASFESGLSGPGRLHDLFVTLEAMSPGDYKSDGDGLRFTWGNADSPFGTVFVAWTDRGICRVSFSKQALVEVRDRWPRAAFVENRREAAAILRRMFDRKDKIRLCVGGTNFQIKVWEALVRIPEGTITTYGEIAQWIGHPRAMRAVGSAVGANPIAYLIPCHRVIRSLGVFGNYRWGETRKKAMLGWEMALRSPS